MGSGSGSNKKHIKVMVLLVVVMVDSKFWKYVSKLLIHDLS